MSYPSFWKSASVFLGLSVFYVLVQFSPTRSLLLKFLPAPGEGPKREDIAKGHFTHQLVAEAVTTGDERPLRAYATVKGHKDPGYGETIMYVTEAALCLALDRAKLSHQGGVLTPAAAMGDALIHRYRQRGGVFEVTSEPFLPSKI
ncbi:hypothetical protein H4R35_006334 [Dimargaris xerosporica]|nr:hypothetical protein H4R35_006334 [Dimargaris xerosporica]